MPEQGLEAYLGKLEAQRAALDVQIAGLRAELGLEPSKNGAGVLPTVAGLGREPAAAGRVSSTEFFRMTVPEAIQRYLEIMKQPQTPKAIADGLKAGGILSEAKHFYSNVFTALKRLQDAGKFVNTKRGWAPSWWFEGRSGAVAESKPKRKKKGAKGVAKSKNAVPAISANPKSHKSGYHAFLAEQLKAGKTMKEAAVAWQKKKQGKT